MLDIADWLQMIEFENVLPEEIAEAVNEIQRLRAENQRLRAENEKLTKALQDSDWGQSITARLRRIGAI